MWNNHQLTQIMHSTNIGVHINFIASDECKIMEVYVNVQMLNLFQDISNQCKVSTQHKIYVQMNVYMHVKSYQK